jgi:hypothetical protein
MIVTQSVKIESALRDLLLSQQASIKKDAPFVYEVDTLSGGVTIREQGKVVIGEWIVEIAEPHAHATIQRRFGKGEHFESEVVEVDLKIEGNFVKVSDWRAYREWGRNKGD